MKFELTYDCGNNIFSANVVYAANEEAARLWYERVEHKTVIGCREMISPYIKPGMPVTDVPMNATEIREKFPA